MALYPLWAWGTVLAVHTAARTSGGGCTARTWPYTPDLNAGLVAINIDQGGGPWATGRCPLASPVTHALIASGDLALQAPPRDASRDRRAGALLAIIGRDNLVVALTRPFFPLLLLAAHWLVRERGWSLLRAQRSSTQRAGRCLIETRHRAGRAVGALPFRVLDVQLPARAHRAPGRRWEGAVESYADELGAGARASASGGSSAPSETHVSSSWPRRSVSVLLDVIGGEGTRAAGRAGSGTCCSPSRRVRGRAAAVAGIAPVRLGRGPPAGLYARRRHRRRTWWSAGDVRAASAATVLGGIWTRPRPATAPNARRAGADRRAGEDGPRHRPPAWWFSRSRRSSPAGSSTSSRRWISPACSAFRPAARDDPPKKRILSCRPGHPTGVARWLSSP